MDKRHELFLRKPHLRVREASGLRSHAKAFRAADIWIFGQERDLVGDLEISLGQNRIRRQTSEELPTSSARVYQRQNSGLTMC